MWKFLIQKKVIYQQFLAVKNQVFLQIRYVRLYLDILDFLVVYVTRYYTL
jgi:hypothetical protein